MRTIQISPEYYQGYRTGGIVTFVSGLIILLLGFSNLGPIPLLIVLILVMLAPVFYGLKVWIQMLGAEEAQLT
jgi:hypothetical protein